LLISLLAVNASIFLVRGTFGWLAQSTVLLSDSLDTLTYAAVYSIALLAVIDPTRFKMRAALRDQIILEVHSKYAVRIA